MHPAQQGNGGFGNNYRKGGVGQILVWMMLFISILGSATISFAADIPLFGPKRYERTQGKPPLYIDTFTGCSATGSLAVIKVRNGSSKASSLSSAVISLNGAAVFSEPDFKNQTPWLEKVVPFRPGSNTLAVELKSAGQQETPFLTIDVLGRGCDVTPPVITNPQPVDAALLNIARPAISAAFTDNSGSGVDTASVRVTLDGSDITTACSITATGVACTLTNNLTDGAHSVTVAVADLAKNPASYSWRFTTDTTPPNVMITAPPGGVYTNVATAVVSGSVNEAITSVTVNGQPATVNASDSTFILSGLQLAEGINNIVVTAVDKAGNSGTASVSVILDTVPPAAVITAPINYALLSTPQVTVSGTISEVLLSLLVNGVPVQMNGSLFTLPLTLNEGFNTITVTAVDLAGNRSSSAVSVTLDSTPPLAPLLDPQTTPTRVAAITLSGRSEPSATVRLFNNAQSLGTVQADAAGLFSLSGVTLTEGLNTITTLAADAAGNEGPLSKQLALVLDTKPPVIAITSPADRLFLNAPAVTVIGSIDDQTATVTVNGIAATISGATFTAPGVPLSDGVNVLVVTVIDPADNHATAQVSVTLDTALPVVTITAPLDGSFTAIPAVTVSGTVSEAASAVTVNGKAATLTGNSFILENLTLAEGQNTLNVVAVDLAGNKGTAIATVTLDTVNPLIFVSVPADGLLTRNPQVMVSGTVSEPLATLSINGQPVTVNGQAFTTTITLTEGNNSIVLEATDRAGNKGTATINVTLDSTPPVAPLLEALPAITNNPVATLRGSAEAGSRVVLYIGDVSSGQTVADQSGLFSFPNITLTEGMNTFTAVSLDLAGNTSQISESVNVTLDTKAPATAITTPADKAILNTQMVTVSGGIDDPTAQVTVNGLPAQGSGGIWTLEGFTLQEGNNSLLVEARDPAGNKGSASATVVLDTIPPVVTVTAPVDGLYTNLVQVTVIGTVNEEVASVTINGVAASVSLASPAKSTFTGTLTLTEGTNSIVVTAVDKAGNSASTTAAVTLDTIAPQLAVIGPADGALLSNGQITFGGSAAEPVTSVQVNGTTVQADANGGYTLPVTLAEGSNSLSVTAIDRAGNSSTSTITVNLDSTPPAAPLLNAQVTPIRTVATIVSGEAEANATVKLFNNGGPVATLKADAAGLFSVGSVTLTEGNNLFTATATDAAGNVSQLSAPLTVVLDTKAPLITVTAPQPGVVVGAAQVTISGTVDEPLASLAVNGASVPLNSLNFEYVLTLAAGENSALITATDLAGNIATTTITVQRDSTPPKVAIIAPLNGLLTNSLQIQVSGTVDDAEATLTVGGAAVAVVNKAFSVGYLLTDGDNNIQVKGVDKAGNEGTAAVMVTLDAQAPVVTLVAPATATAGTDVQITVNATDNLSLTLVDLSADGASLWSVAPSGVTASQGVSMRLSPTLNPGTTVTVRGRALDAAGNSGSATTVITIDKGADGPGWLQGKVLDDSRGLPLGGAQVNVIDAKGVQQNITTPADGAWFFELASGAAKVEVVKSGFTTVHRDVTVRPGQRTSVLDSRLTKLDGTIHIVDATGSVVKSTPLKIQNSSFTIDVSIPVDALSAQADVRLTPVSNQGLIASLPLGWSPLAVADLRLLDPITAAPIDPQQLSAPATLTLPLPTGLGDAVVTAELARYDSVSRTWLAVADVAIAANTATATAQINQPGQYALVLADPPPLNPPTPTTGQELAAATLTALDFSLITTTGRVVPQAALPSVGLLAAGDLLLVAKPDAATAPAMISGLIVNARVTEKFDLTGGSTLQPTATMQDIVLYRAPCATSISGGATEGSVSGAGGSVSGAELRTTFPVSPSRDFTIVDLLLGKISIEITQPDTSGGVMVGADGARLLQPDGTSLSIPAGALTGTVPVTVSTIPEATVSSLVGADFRLLRGVDVAITGQTLKSSATLSIPAPTGFDPALPVVVAKKFDVKGVSKLKLVAMGKLSGSIISSDATITAGNETIVAQGITTSGQYLFLQAVAPIGYVAGQITDSAAAPFAGIQVSAQSATLADLTGVNGQYLLALAAGSQTITALDPTRGDAASGTIAIAANTKSSLNLTVRMVPPTVVSISPANGAANVQPSVPVVVTFSKPMDKTTITLTTLKLNDLNGTAVPGVLTFNVDNTAVTFYPSDAFKQETSYNVTVAATVKDLQGYQLGQDVVSVFVVRRTIPPAMPAAGAISGTFPDADGFITVTGTQGSAAAGNTVLLINDTSGEIQSVTPLSNGSFTGKVRGQLGDEIKVVLMDYSGNQTTISYLTFKGPDGSYLVTARGGKVEGEGGSLLDIPDGALVGPTVIKITAIQEADLPNPVQAPGTYMAGFNIDTGGIGFQKEVHLSIPVPVGHKPETAVFVTKPGELANGDGTIEKVYEIIDSTKIVNGRITTASPPFDGIMGIGSYVFTAFPDVQLGVVSGITYQDMNDMPGYQPAPAGVVEIPTKDAAGNTIYKYDRPIQGAVVRTPAAWNYVSYSKSAGTYAGFTTLYGNVGATDLEYKLTATHPQTMRRENVTVYLTADGSMSYNIKDINFKLAEKDTILPDKTPPVIDLNLSIAPGQTADARIIAGTVIVGTELLIPIRITNQQMGTASLTISYAAPGAITPASIPVVLNMSGSGQVATQNGPLTRYTYTPAFPADFKGSQPYYFKATQEGTYIFTIEATASSGSKNSRSVGIRAISSGSSLGSGIEGVPSINGILPADMAIDVMVTAPVVVWFSEPVENVNEFTFGLYDTVTSNKVPATVRVGLEGGRMQAVLTPNGNLYYNRKYEVRLSSAITDSFDNSSGGKLNLVPLSASFTTKTPKQYDLNDAAFSGRDIDLYTFTDADGDSFTYAYLTAGIQGWRIVDVTDPTASYTVFPSAGKTFSAGFDYRNLAVNQDKELLGMTENITFADGNQYGYVRFYDLNANSDDPPIIAQEKLAEAYSGIPGRIAMMGDYAYVATINAGLQVISLETAKANFTIGSRSDGSSIVGAFDSVGQGYGQPNDIAVYGGSKALLTTNSGNLLTLDVSLPFPQLMAQFQPSGNRILRVALAPEYAYQNPYGGMETGDIAVVGTMEGRVLTIDLTDPYVPKVMAITKDFSKDPNGIELLTTVRELSVSKEAGMAFVTTFNSVQVIDIKDPNNPRLLITFDKLADQSGAVDANGNPILNPLGQIPAIVEKEGWVYLASQAKGIKVIDVDPHHLITSASPITLASNTKGPSLADVNIDFEVFPDKAIIPNEAYLIVLEDQNEIWKTKLTVVEGKGSVTYPAVTLKQEFDVTKKYESAIRLVDGSNVSTEGGNKRIPLQWPILSTDFDHNGKIDEADRVLANSGEMFRFWVNDDDDSGETGGSDIPNSGSNGTDSNVNGVRDLSDFFPVHIDLMDLATKYDPARYIYQLRCDKSNINIVETDLFADRSGEYLIGDGIGLDPVMKLKDAATKNVTSKGIALSPAFVKTAKDTNNQNAGVLLVEGRLEGECKLTLNVLDKGQPVYASQPLTIKLTGVEQMFRHVNLIDAVGGPSPETGSIIGEHKAKGGEKSRVLEPKNFPNSQTDNKYFVMLHGFKNDGQVARGWHSEMFKRLYWSGSRVRFVGVSWYGFENIPDYQQNVVNAFRTASIFGQRLAAVTGGAPVTIMAHSLGNMVVSGYLSDYFQTNPLNVTDYFLFNAAVALEAYLGDYKQYAEGKLNDPFADDNPMVHPDWEGYQKRFASSEWHQLFDASDPRSTLTWRNRFANMPNIINYHSFYSTGEDVLATHTGTPWLFQAIRDAIFNNARYSWAFQEKWKGRAPVFDGLGGTTTMGWGFNLIDEVFNPKDSLNTTTQGNLDGATANATIDNETLKGPPFFNKSIPDGVPATLFDEGFDANLQQNFARARLLGRAIPALTSPAGGWSGKDIQLNDQIGDYVDMNDAANKNGWPSDRSNNGDFNWKHSDIKVVPYTYSYKIFNMLTH
jgi:hypothetical protein